MIEYTQVNGRSAAVAYFDDSFNLVSPDKATVVKVIFEDGTIWFGTPTKATADANPYHEPAGSEHGGEFAEAPGGHDLSKAMTRSLENSGGFTFNSHGVTPKTGFAVGGYDGKPQWDVESFTKEDANGFLAQNAALLHSGQGYHVGGWVDNGKVYLDVVKVFGSRRGAVKAGRKNNQIAIADLSRIHAKDFDHAFIPTGGTGDAMPDDEEVKGTFHLFAENVTAEELFAAIKGATTDQFAEDANMKYYADLPNGESVELSNVGHDGSVSTKPKHFSGFGPNGERLTATRKIEYGANPSKHPCGPRCLNATGHSCECACGGANHGKGAATTDYNPNHEPAGSEHGGEFAKGGGYTMYHGTTSDVVDAIKKEGLRADVNRNYGKAFYAGDRSTDVFLTSDETTAWEWGADSPHKAPSAVVVAIHIPSSHLDRLQRDDYTPGSTVNFRFKGNIPPQWIKKIDVGPAMSVDADLDGITIYAVILCDNAVDDYNPNHAPAGTPEGGQFTSGEGGSAVIGKMDPKEVQRLFQVGFEKHGGAVPGLKEYAQELCQSIYDDYDFEGYNRGVRDAAVDPFLAWLTGDSAIAVLIRIAGEQGTKVDALKALIEVAEGEIRTTLTKMLEHTVADAAMDKHARASRKRLLDAANWLREAATGDWLKDIED